MNKRSDAQHIDDGSAVPSALIPLQDQTRPGAFAVAGPGIDDDDLNHARLVMDDATVQIGDEEASPPNTCYSVLQDPLAISTQTPLDAVVVDRSRRNKTSSSAQQLPPLVEAAVDTSCTIRDGRVQFSALILLLLVMIGVALGVVFGVVLPNDGTTVPVNVPTTAPSPPDMSVLSWVDAGSVVESTDGAKVLSLSPDGTRVALVGNNFTTVQVYEERSAGTWMEQGNVIPAATTSLSLKGNRLAVGNAAGGPVSVFELSGSDWMPAGNSIEVEGWTVVLSKDGKAIAVELKDSVQVYQLINDTTWLPKGNSIATESERVDTRNGFSRTAMNDNGTILLVEKQVYLYAENQWIGQGLLAINDDPPNTPVSISANGNVVAIGQHESNINGLNSGRVRVFRLDGEQWTHSGDDIIGDGQVNGFYGWSHSLSGDGGRIAVMNNPVGEQTRASVFRLQGSRWTRALEDAPFAAKNGTIMISDNGGRVAIGGTGDTVRVFDIVSSEGRG